MLGGWGWKELYLPRETAFNRVTDVSHRDRERRFEEGGV